MAQRFSACAVQSTAGFSLLACMRSCPRCIEPVQPVSLAAQESMQRRFAMQLEGNGGPAYPSGRAFLRRDLTVKSGPYAFIVWNIYSRMLLRGSKSSALLTVIKDVHVHRFVFMYVCSHMPSSFRDCPFFCIEQLTNIFSSSPPPLPLPPPLPRNP